MKEPEIQQYLRAITILAGIAKQELPILEQSYVYESLTRIMDIFLKTPDRNPSQENPS